MSVTRLKQSIFENISQIDDIEFLNAIKVILDSKNPNSGFKLSEFQLERIQNIHQQYEQGQTQTHEDLQLEIEQWLSTK